MATYVVSWERAPHFNESGFKRFDELFAAIQDDTSKFDRIEFLPCLDGATGFLIIETDDPTLVHQSLLTFTGIMRYRVHAVNDFEGMQQASSYARKVQTMAPRTL